MLSAIRTLKRLVGESAAVIGKTMGPWTLAYHCFGLENFLLMSVDDPGMTRRCLDKLKEVTVEFGLAQLDAGADALTLPDHATGDLVHARYYDTFLRDIHAEFAARLPAPVILLHLRQDAGPHEVHQQDRLGRLPFRFEERPGCLRPGS